MKFIYHILFISSILTTLNLDAQEKWHMGLSGGVSIPLGEFGKDAAIGPSFAFDINKADSSRLKLLLSLRHISNGFLSHDRNLSQITYSRSGSNRFSSIDFGEYRLSGSTWHSTGIFAGGKPTYALGQKLQFSMLLQFGLLLNQSPKIKLSLIEGAVDNSGTIESAFSTSMAFVAGIGIDYQLNDRWYCQLNSHYFSSNALYDVKLITNNQEQIDNLQIRQWLQTLQCTLGIGIKF